MFLKDRTIYTWSLRYAKKGSSYELRLEGCFDIKLGFADKAEELQTYAATSNLQV